MKVVSAVAFPNFYSQLVSPFDTHDQTLQDVVGNNLSDQSAHCRVVDGPHDYSEGGDII